MTARISPERAVIWLGIVAIPIGAFALFMAAPSVDGHFMTPPGHFYIVGATAVICAMLAGAASIAAVQIGSARTLLLALAFLSMAGVFSVHGLATPGFVVNAGPEYGVVVGFSARLALLLAATFLAASAVDWPRNVAAPIERYAGRILALAVALLGIYACMAFATPRLVPPRLMSEDLFLDGSLVIVLAVSAFSAWRYYRHFRLSRLPMSHAATLGAVLMFQAQLSMHFGTLWHASWWMYHVQLLAAFGALFWALVSEYARGRSANRSIQGLTVSGELEQIKAGYADVVRALATSLEVRDPYTHGHGHRVAALSVLIGQQLKLKPARLRALAQGALLHDVGKIGVPDDVLCKPGSLTEAEFAEIKKHPALGAHMLASAFSGSIERAVIRHHHEWYDGTGYPDGLRGDQIPFEARIAAVADVYDALRSNRAYRGAWNREQTRALILQESGTHFDPTCVETLMRVADRWEAEFGDEIAHTEQRAVSHHEHRHELAAEAA